MIRQAATVTTDQQALDALEQLAAGTLKYSDVFTPDADGNVQVGGVSVRAADAGSVLDAAVEPTGTMRALLNSSRRLAELQKVNETRVANITATLAKKARAGLMKSPTTKSQVQLSELVDTVRHTALLNNPLGIASSAAHVRHAQHGDQFVLRMVGSVVGDVRAGETPDAARARLGTLIPDDTEALIAMAGLQATPKNKEDFFRMVTPYTGQTAEGLVGVVVVYGIRSDNVTRAARIASKLAAAAEKGAMHLVDPSFADAATLRLNLTEAQQLAELEAETGESDALEDGVLDAAI